MKKIFFMLLAALMITTVFAGCSSTEETTQTDNSNVPSSDSEVVSFLTDYVLSDLGNLIFVIR